MDLSGTVVIPGQVIPPVDDAKIIPGAGVVQSDERTLIATVAGTLSLLASKAKTPNGQKVMTASVETNQKRYTPAVHDQVLGVITSKHGEHYRVDIGASREAHLPVLSFQGATKRNRPNLSVGTLVYGQVCSANADMKPELTCISSHFKKEWMTGESLFGELKGGYMFSCSTQLVRDLLDERCVVLGALGASVPFEVAVGANGRVWVRADTPVHTILASNCIANSEHLSDDMTKVMVRELLALTDSRSH